MSKQGLSLINIAEGILKAAKEPVDIYTLFDKACEEKGLEEELKNQEIAQFYADVTTSAKFVYVGENTWDLKENQKADLWEKDGSFFKEYTKIELPEEYKDKPKPAAKKEEVVVEVAEEVAPEPVIEEPVVVQEPVAVAESTDEPVEGIDTELTNDEFDEDLFDDFDEDKYNEYMDTYEDQYED